MGRCYEFGVEIHAGCEQAMVVTAAGGACQCTACATTCPGRFAGCAAVVAIPGRVPPSAPQWSVPQGDRVARQTFNGGAPTTRTRPEALSESGVPAARRAPPPAPTASSPLAPRPAGIGGRSKGSQRDIDGAIGQELLGAIEALREEVRRRDEHLVSGLEAQASRQAKLSTEIAVLGTAVDGIPTALAKPIVAIGESVIQLTTELSKELRRIESAVDRLTAHVVSLEDRLAKPASLRDAIARRL